eukprot:2319841-Rhodomonas_salina.1
MDIVPRPLACGVLCVLSASIVLRHVRYWRRLRVLEGATGCPAGSLEKRLSDATLTLKVMRPLVLALSYAQSGTERLCCYHRRTERAQGGP